MQDPFLDSQNKGGSEAARRTSVGATSSMKKASSTANLVDDLSSIFGGIYICLIRITIDDQAILYSIVHWLNYFCLQKLLEHLETSKRLKGKLKRGEELGWNVIKGLRSARYVFYIDL